MAFFQAPPQLGNLYDDDALLREYVSRTLPAAMRAEVEPEYREIGALAGGELYRAQLADRENEPVLTQWDPWGHRIDHIEVSPLWKRAQVIAAERGLVAAGYEPRWGPHARVHQFVLNYLLNASLDVYSCPLAMTDGAARTLLDSGNQALVDHAVRRLLSRDPRTMWTSGQWMTERTGGSDVGQSETVARKYAEGQWRLYGTKWFTSATTSEMALTLARPEGNPPGSRGLALFYLELRDDDGLLRNIEVNRLKDKLGTRKVPTAELTLAGTPATLVAEPRDGVRAITPMLGLTRTWNTVCAASGMRRAVALACDFARKRRVFGEALVDKPLHVDTLAGMVAETDGACLMAFLLTEVLGRVEHARRAAGGGAQGAGDSYDERLLRALTSIAKLTTGKQAVAVASEALECFGGGGYIEDTGFPRLLADAQVLSIWEGTTNVLSLETLRALTEPGLLEAFAIEVHQRAGKATDPALAGAAQAAQTAVDRAALWAADAGEDRPRLEAGARRFAMTLGRALELALLVEHAAWCGSDGHGERATAAARRFAREAIDLTRDLDRAESDALLEGAGA